MTCFSVMTSLSPSGSDPLRSRLWASHQLPAHRFGAVVHEHARMMGALEAVVYLADYEQHHLVAVQDEGAPRREDITVDGSVGGLAFRRVEPMRSPVREGGGTRLWVPLLDGAERAGVVELLFPGEVPDAVEEEARSFTSLVAELAVTRDAYSDVFAKLRRTRQMSVAAEIQWELVPPLTFGSDRIVVSGVLEPSYDIGGDTFDYAVNEGVADLMVLDAVGHGLPAALLATAAVGAYRAGRRRELPLPEISALMNGVIAEQFSAGLFATAVIARLDLGTGTLTWVNAGHPAPLVVRGSRLLPPPDCRPARPLGLQEAPARECRMHLQPGDRVLLYTDGIVEARSPEGEFFGEERLGHFVVRAEGAGDSPPETLRRLMHSVLEHQAGRLQDDASIVLVEWRTGREDQLIL
jgi:serine phosphatase RsbU (regulator of sigma subunit)